MAVFDKLKFWKKEEPLSVPDVAAYGTNLGLQNPNATDTSLGLNQDILQQQRFDVGRYAEPGFGQEPMAQEQGAQPYGEMPSQSSFSKMSQTKQAHQAPDIYSLSREIELISSKIETIKAILEHLEEKVDKIEKIAEGEKEPGSKRYNRW